MAGRHGVEPPPRIVVERMRWQLYNATLVSVRRAHDALAVFRVRPDRPVEPFKAGQYVLLGLGDWEPCPGAVVPGARSGQDARESRRPGLIRRVYSICCPMLDERGALVRAHEHEWLEFYIARVTPEEGRRPGLTPRLFALEAGDRLFMGEHVRGRYTVDPVGLDDDVVFCATGTGEAPHNAMVAELLARGHRGRIVVAVTARHARDLAYLDTHRQLERSHPNYRYVALTTREPHNLDRSRADFVGKVYLQEMFGDEARCETMVGFVPQPGRAHFFLCGNPDMLGLPQRDDEGRPVFPERDGMAELLVGRGFRLDDGDETGDVHFEKYW